MDCLKYKSKLDKGDEPMIDLKANPFFLNDSAISWVENTLASMSVADKIGQLFLHFGTDDKQLITDQILPKNIGGMLYRPRRATDVRDLHAFLQEHSKIPLLLAANIEDGGVGIATEGTFFARQMQVAAANNPIHDYHNGIVSCSEAASVGVNWAFGPVADMDLNFRNPITNVKTYGDDPDRVLANGLEFMRGAKENGVAVAVKHFPGEGPDELDQHLATVVNGQSCEEWERTIGRVFKGMIDGGALTIMAGHIAMPAYQRKFNPDFPEQVIPATLSRELLQDLLRGQLGFNGMIVSDTTTIGGFMTAMPREQAVPLAIASGCDMFMYSKNFAEDYRFMMKGYEDGVITEQRLDDAITRILATKAALNLHEKQKAGTLVPSVDALNVLRCEKHQQWARECADASVTLVKDTQQLLPITPEKHQRVMLELMGDSEKNDQIMQSVMEKLSSKGFVVTDYDPHYPSTPMDSITAFKKEFDLVLYIGNFETRPNKTVSRINWYSTREASNLPWFVKEVPTLFISLANPYHLIDVPMIKTYINCYAASEYTLEAAIEKITGQSDFKGINPIDPFCGRWDTRL
jgi:beta-N-acetylhexosaminidase